jgi:hypothetical protein
MFDVFENPYDIGPDLILDFDEEWQEEMRGDILD